MKSSVFKKIFAYSKRWLFTTNHGDIGTLYLWFSCILFFTAGIFALLIRTELFKPGMQIMQPEFYNQLVTFHGLIMIFGVIMPAFAGLANWQIPLMIGAHDMAFPRMNNWSFWLLPFAFILLLSTLFMPGDAPNFGWTMYAPLSTTFGPPSTDFLIFAIHLMGLSSILAGINIIATIMNMRTREITWKKLPIFVWSWLITAFLLLGVMPVLAGTVTMMLFDRHFGTSFFNAAGGGDPLLYQHLFWFFAHPEVYILILPAFGVISEVVPTFSRKALFGRVSMILAMTAIAVLSYIVWVHHMFTSGVPLFAQLIFMYTTMLIAVPTGIKVFNWVTTMFKGAISFETPMLFAIGFIFMFTIGGFSGLMLAIVPADFQYQDTYFVVAHLHYVLIAGSLFALFSAIYYWIPLWTHHRYSEILGRWHFWLTVIAFNITFLPMHFLGLSGMPRRIPDYALKFTDFNSMATVGAFIFAFAQLLFLINVIKTIRSKKDIKGIIWEGAEGLEWKHSR